jgi:LysM domain
MLHWGTRIDFPAGPGCREKDGVAMVQQFRKSITALAFFLASGWVWAQGNQAPWALRPDAPDRYVVVRGDTLWAISQRYTDSPWRWPELWNMNKDQIRNPHLIYPGYVILLDRVRGQLSISSGESSSQTVSGTGMGTGAVKLSPRTRMESLAKLEIPSIPPAAIEPFLRRPLVIEPDGLDRAPTIVGTEADRVILAAGNKAYVRGISDSKEDTWYVYRRGGPLVDPDTNQTLGFEAIYLGTAQVTRPGDPTTVVLSSAVQEVGAGDKLVAAGNPQPPSYAPHPPTSEVRGRVMSIYGGLGKVGEAGQHSIITINRGRANGLEVGHVLALYSAGEVVRDVTSDSKIKLPDERSGLAFVFRVFDRVSYALIMHVTRPVSPLDVVQNP